MEIKTLFSVPVGISNHKELLPGAVNLFTYKELFGMVDLPDNLPQGNYGQHWTTLNGYNKRNESVMPDDPAVDDIKKVILEEVIEFARQFGYDVSKYDFEVTNLWMNTMYARSFHKQHSHYGHTFSGCFYVVVPENSGLISFTNPSTANKSEVKVTDWTTHAATAWSVETKPGDIVVWESYLKHEVPMLDYIGPRMTMAFDVDVYFKED